MSDGEAARRRLAAALRPIITLTVAGTAEDDAYERAAAAVEAIGAELAEGAGETRRVRLAPDSERGADEYFPTSPVAGAANPLAPPVAFEIVDGPEGGPKEIRGTGYFDYPYEGPPSCVHGGIIAETFDELMGAANMVAENPGMTGTLTVKYRKPTPLRAQLTMEARCTGRSGRKVTTWAGIFHEGVLTAEAEGIFIMVGPRQMLAIAEQNQDGQDPGLLAAMREAVERLDPA